MPAIQESSECELSTTTKRLSRVKFAAIGCGGHAIRNVFSTHEYAPIDLVGVCDLDRARAEHCARMFGGQRVYTDYREMLAKEKPEAVQVVTNYDEQGRPRYPGIAIDAMRTGRMSGSRSRRPRVRPRSAR